MVTIGPLRPPTRTLMASCGLTRFWIIMDSPRPGVAGAVEGAVCPKKFIATATIAAPKTSDAKRLLMSTPSKKKCRSALWRDAVNGERNNAGGRGILQVA